ncbi:hypothetical protein [Leisingera sp. ANG-DT]|uniref:hypothetical protein n=1 Tax=Leisingera sp. ANG-DT TaxID=1577897 RepID=UPI0019D342D1|nr:hypothetical protein [Leisingera sp. ANG-DT]
MGVVGRLSDDLRFCMSKIRKDARSRRYLQSKRHALTVHPASQRSQFDYSKPQAVVTLTRLLALHRHSAESSSAFFFAEFTVRPLRAILQSNLA